MDDARKTSKPAPLKTDPHEQKDDNIDAEGNRDGGGKQEQPTRTDKQGDKKR